MHYMQCIVYLAHGVRTFVTTMMHMHAMHAWCVTGIWTVLRTFFTALCLESVNSIWGSQAGMPCVMMHQMSPQRGILLHHQKRTILNLLLQIAWQYYGQNADIFLPLHMHGTKLKTVCMHAPAILLSTHSSRLTSCQSQPCHVLQ